MNSPSIEPSKPLLVREKESFPLGNYQIEISSYLGLLTPGVHHFKVKIRDLDDGNISAEGEERNRWGLLRIGSIDDALSRELKLRQDLGGYGLIAPLLAHRKVESVEIDTNAIDVPTGVDKAGDSVPEEPAENSEEIAEELKETPGDIQEERSQTTQASEENKNPQIAIEDEDFEDSEELFASTVEDEEETPSSTAADVTREDNNPESETTDREPIQSSEPPLDYLKEEIYREIELNSERNSPKLLLLTDLPQQERTLANWLQSDYSQTDAIALIVQLCQLFTYLAKQDWCAIDIFPNTIEVGKPLKIFDLTSIHPTNEKLAVGVVGNYCAPELAASSTINELTSSYTIGALFYQLIHHKLPELDGGFSLAIEPIPRIYQLIKIALSSDPQERFPLSQFLNLSIELRNSLKTPKVQWNIASRSTVGLSTHRLHNEDSYGVKQQQLSNAETVLLGIVADGMGGMAQGDEASKIAVEVLLESPLPKDLKTADLKNQWLLDLFQQANQSISDKIKNGGTTLSAVLAIDRELVVAHVGDSRIYLLRNGEIQQISEDHSLVAMKVASGEITEEESLTHPERNVLLKSLGSKKSLSDGYVQNLTRTMDVPSTNLEDGDILLLCSDGVWDLVSKPEFQEVFTTSESLQLAVDRVIQLTLDRGASDNSTLLALEYFVN
jgi:PPM family protein phosphatase